MWHLRGLWAPCGTPSIIYTKYHFVGHNAIVLPQNAFCLNRKSSVETKLIMFWPSGFDLHKINSAHTESIRLDRICSFSIESILLRQKLRQNALCWDRMDSIVVPSQTTKMWTSFPASFYHKYLIHVTLYNCRNLGAVSIRKTVLPGMAIPMLKIRRPNGRLIFNMENAIRR